MRPAAAPATGRAERRTDWPLVAALFVAGLFAAAQFAKVSLALPAWAEAYPARDGIVTLLVSAVGIVGIVLGVVAGAAVARVGPGRALLAALALGGVVSLFQAPGLPFWLLVLTRMAEGVSHMVIVVAAPTLMAIAASDRDRSVAMSLWGMFFGVSFAVSALAIPPLLAWGGLRALTLIHGAGLLLCVALVLPRLPIRTTAPHLPEGFLAAHRAAYGDPRRLAPALGFFWHTLLFVALLTFLPAHLPAGSATLLPLASLTGTFAAGWLARRVAPHRIALASFSVTMPLMVALWLTPETLRLAVALPLFVSIGLVPGASFAAVPWLNDTANDQARAQGVIAQLGNLGTTLGTPVLALCLAAGPAAGIAGFTLALSAAGIASLVWIYSLPALAGVGVRRLAGQP